MNILFISNNFELTNSNGSGRLNDLVAYLCSEGHSVQILASTYNYLTGRIDGKYKKRLFTIEGDDKCRVIKTWTYDGYHKSYTHRTIAFVSFIASSIIGQFRLKGYDVVFVGTPPFFLGIPAFLASRRAKVPLIYEVRDLWSDVAVEMGLLRSRVVINAIKWTERFLYSSSRVIVTNSPAFAPFLQDLGVPSEKIIYIPNGVNLDQFNIDKVSADIRSRLDIKDELVCIYVGSHGRANNLDYILNAAKALVSDKRFKFLFVGDGNYKKMLVERARSEGIVNSIFLEPVPKKDLAGYIRASDVGLATLLDTPKLRTTYPNKVFDYMACGRPTIVAIDGVIRSLVEDSGCGFFVDPNDPAELVAILKSVVNDRENLKRMGERAFRYLRENFDRSISTKQLAKTILENGGRSIGG
ncbi:glycosyltransferase WbuB [bacterium]|nr:MAG: glycosyltransferase WbuB [bacterium]